MVGAMGAIFGVFICVWTPSSTKVIPFMGSAVIAGFLVPICTLQSLALLLYCGSDGALVTIHNYVIAGYTV